MKSPSYRRFRYSVFLLIAPLTACGSSDSPSDIPEDGGGEAQRVTGTLTIPDFSPNVVRVVTDGGAVVFQLFVTPVSSNQQISNTVVAFLEITWELRNPVTSNNTNIFAEMEFVPNSGVDCILSASSPSMRFVRLDTGGSAASAGNVGVGFEGLSHPQTFTWTWNGVLTSKTTGWDITGAFITGSFDCAF